MPKFEVMVTHENYMRFVVEADTGGAAVEKGRSAWLEVYDCEPTVEATAVPDDTPEGDVG